MAANIVAGDSLMVVPSMAGTVGSEETGAEETKWLSAAEFA